MIGGTTSLVGLLRDPKVGSLSPRMQNAAFAARALDVAYVPLGVPPEQLGDAVRGLVALGFLGANVTTPHKRAVVALCDEVEGGVESVEHARHPGRPRARLQHGHGGARGSPARQARLLSERAARRPRWIAELEARGAEVRVFARKRRVAAQGVRTPSSSSRRRR